MKKSTLKISSLFLLFLFFLPFTKALTINVGFPLKVSELILVVLIFVFTSRLRIKRKCISMSSINLILILFLIWATMSFLVNSIWDYSYPFKLVPNRINPIFDSFLRLIYIYLSIITFFITQKFLNDKSNVLRFWVTGAIIVSVYSWYLFLFSGFNLSYIKLFGMDDNPQSLGGFIRCGTFKEGNFFGLYLLLSAVIAFRLNQFKTGIFLMFTIVTTVSTVTFISAFVFVIYVMRRWFLRKKVFKYVIFLLPIIVIVFMFFTKTAYFQDSIYNKLQKPANELSSGNISKVDRVLTGRIAVKQGLNNPIFGVGPYNFGLHYDEYNDFETYIINNNDWSKTFFKRYNRRAIPNNVYLEVWSEYGIVGFTLFVIFLLKIFLKAYKAKNDILTGGVLALMISFNAFPSFIMLFIWVFLAIPTTEKKYFNLNESNAFKE